MKPNKLPKLQSMLLPVAFTLIRGVKIKKDGISLQKTFDDVLIKPKNLQNFVDHFNFKSSNPLCYLYILAQRAQTALMLDKAFSIAIPGMIHIENQLTQIAPYQIDTPFQINVKVNVAYKEEGSLTPTYLVEFFQNSSIVAVCKSVYLVKRKSNKKKSNKENQVIENLSLISKKVWSYPLNLGRKYALISGDYNPIHTSNILAKLFGFRRMIIHGWYSVCKVVSECETMQNEGCKNVSVNFLNPIFIPSEKEILFYKKNELELAFEIVSIEDKKTSLIGDLKFYQ